MSSVDILEAVDPVVDNLDTNSVRNLTGARLVLVTFVTFRIMTVFT